MSKVQKFIDRIEKTLKDNQERLVNSSLEIFDKYFESQREDLEEYLEQEVAQSPDNDQADADGSLAKLSQQLQNKSEAAQSPDNDQADADGSLAKLSQQLQNLENLQQQDIAQQQLVSDAQMDRLDNIEKVIENLNRRTDTQDSEKTSSSPQAKRQEEQTSRITEAINTNTATQSNSANKWIAILSSIKDIVWNQAKQYAQYLPLIVTGVLMLWLLLMKALNALWDWMRSPFESLGEWFTKTWDKLTDYLTNFAKWCDGAIITPIVKWWQRNLPMFLGGLSEEEYKERYGENFKGNVVPGPVPSSSDEETGPGESTTVEEPVASVSSQVLSQQVQSVPQVEGTSNLVVHYDANAQVNENQSEDPIVPSIPGIDTAQDIAMNDQSVEQSAPQNSVISTHNTHVTAININAHTQDSFVNYG